LTRDQFIAANLYYQAGLMAVGTSELRKTIGGGTIEAPSGLGQVMVNITEQAKLALGRYYDQLVPPKPLEGKK
jgi:hypothetical protein